MAWVEIMDADGQPSLMNVDNVLGLKASPQGGTLFTTLSGGQFRINTTYNEMKAKLVYTPEEPVALSSITQKGNVEIHEPLPEPMKAPQGKVGSGDDVAKVVEKLTAKKGGTTSAALG